MAASDPASDFPRGEGIWYTSGMEASPSLDPATAYHEAGHAVVALALGRPVHKVSILPTRDRLGWCEYRKGVFRPTEDWLEREVLIALAGMAAEARHTGTYAREEASRDLKFARSLLVSRAGDRRADRLERRFLAKVEAMLGDDELWAAVEAIAAALLVSGEISGRAAKHFYEQSVEDD